VQAAQLISALQTPAAIISVISTTNHISVSVCICARNRPDELRRALASVSRSVLQPAQIIISDDSDDDRVASVVSDNPLAITYTRGPRSGLGANRNHALSLATAEHVMYLDDDAALGQDFLTVIRACTARISREDRAKAIFTGIEINSGQAVTPHRQGLLGFQSRAYDADEPLLTVVINAAVFPRCLFNSVRFDPSLRYGYDEVDITTQAVALGFTIVPCFDAINFHYPSPVGRREYHAFTDASRLYVTLKRRRWTEGSRLRAWPGFGLAIIHACMSSIRRSGFSGLRETRRTVAQAWAYYSDFVESTRTPGRGHA
jgi:glycosyltransferase involved in cell wall biosynthesis